METLMEGGMVVLRNEGVACRSTITFHSGSLWDRGEKKTERHGDRQTQTGKKRKISTLQEK